MLTNVDIQNAITLSKSTRSEGVQVIVDRVIQEMVAIAFFDIRRAVRPKDGKVIFYDSDTWSGETMAAVGAVSQVFDKEGNYIGVGIKLHDKVAMLRELLKHISSRADDEETLQAGLALTRLLERRLREQKKLGAKQKMHYQAFSKAGSEL